MPVRLSPESAHLVHELCAAVVTTAERARAAARDAASAGPQFAAHASRLSGGRRVGPGPARPLSVAEVGIALAWWRT